MKYKTKLLIYILVLNVVLLGITISFFLTNKLVFTILECTTLLFLIIGIILFRQFSGTMDLIASGTESLKDHDFSMKIKPVKNREFNSFIGVYNKMIDQLRKERVALSEKSFLLAKLMDASPSGILIFNFDDCLSSLNPTAEKFIGFPAEELKSLKLSQLSEKTGGMFEDSKQSKNYIFRKNGNEAYRIQNGFFVDRGFDTRFILIEELTQEIYKTEKSAYGKVIRMMSHEINNSVAAVNSVLQTVRPKLESNPNHQQAIDTCISRNENLNSFMSNFADVVRIPAPKLKTLNLNDIANNTLQLFKNQLHNDTIQFATKLSSSPVWVQADHSQMEQVLINILKNACEAIHQNGQIKITTNAKSASIVITDNGLGITQEQKEKLFTPFYTSKSHGQGIGLTLTKEILMNHNCNFELKSNSALGETQFRIQFNVRSS